jgi:alpha-L-fucosidase
VGELTTAVRKQGLHMGLYYSGGYDWTFVPGPIRVAADYQTVKPQSQAYGKYADAHMRELIARYKPALLWNDIDYPKSGHALEIMAEYYNAIPDGVIDNRFGVKHWILVREYAEKVDQINPKKWEECRGLGRSFGYNRSEGSGDDFGAGVDLSVGGYCQQEWKSIARCWDRRDGTIVCRWNGCKLWADYVMR